MTCEFESLPPAQVEWFFNETNITQKVNTYKEKFEYKYEPSSHSATLIIKNVNEKDKGNYTMQAKNKNGISKSTCMLDVSVKDTRHVSVSEVKSPFVKQLEPNVTVPMGEKARWVYLEYYFCAVFYILICKRLVFI